MFVFGGHGAVDKGPHVRDKLIVTPNSHCSKPGRRRRRKDDHQKPFDDADDLSRLDHVRLESSSNRRNQASRAKRDRMKKYEEQRRKAQRKRRRHGEEEEDLSEQDIERLRKEEELLMKKLEDTRKRMRDRLENEEQDDGDIVASTVMNALVKQQPKTQLNSFLPSGILPVITTDGQNVFEVGLGGGNNNNHSDDKKQHAHALPIFQLPKISKESKIVNPLPKDSAVDEEKARLRLEARRKAQAALGFTDEELRLFGNIADEVTGQNNSPKSPKLQQQRQGKKEKRRNNRVKSPIGTKGNERIKLRKELKTSIENVQSITKTLQKEISELNKQYPLTSKKAQMYIKKFGFGKLQDLFAAMERRKVAQGFERWKKWIYGEKLLEREAMFKKIEGTTYLNRIMENFTTRRIEKAFQQWYRVFRFERDNENYLTYTRSSITIQRCFRGHLGRNIARKRRAWKDYRRQRVAATRIQAIIRGHLARRRVVDIKDELILYRAAVSIQGKFRQRMAKQNVIKRRQVLEEETRAALKVQTAWRRKNNQMAYHLLKQARKDRGATRIQCLARKRAARKRVSILRRKKVQYNSAVMIQKHCRIRLAKRRVVIRREEFLKEREQQERVALKLQAVYRGHRGRIMFQLKQQAKYALLKEQEVNIIMIQGFFRQCMAKERVKLVRKVRFREMCDNARAWRQHYNDSIHAWEFQNDHTHEVLYEPPPVGFLQHDGKLFLANGSVVDDPAIEERREREKHLLKCVECDDFAATRNCTECEDIFCDDCYEAIHSKGKLATHQFEYMQDGKPPATAVEVVDEYVQSPDQQLGAWEELFDETSGAPYWYNAETGATTWENPNPTADTSHDPSWEEHVDPESGMRFLYNIVTGESQWLDQHVPGADENLADGGEWVEYFDENSGMAYLVNSITGETKWAE